MVHESRLPFAPTVRLRLTQPVRSLLTLTIFAIAACDRPEQLAAPTSVEPSLLVDAITQDVQTNGTSGFAAASSLIAVKSNPGMCLEVAGSPSATEVKTRIANCNVNSPAQLFTVNQTTKEIISSGGRCLTALGTGSDAIGSEIGLQICKKAQRQLWTVVATSGQLKGADNGCVTIRGNALKAGAEEFLGSCGWFPSWSQGYVITNGGGGSPTPPPSAPATSISVTPSTVSIGVGATAQLAAVALDASGNPVSGATFTYSMLTSGQAASVSATGLVTSKAAGKDTVRVVSGTLSTKVGVNVLAIAPPPPPTPPPPAPPPSGLKAIDPTLPLDSVKVIWPVRTGKVIAVHAGDNLQNALNQAQRGDEIVIDPVTFSGNFVLPAKSGTAANGWILVRSANLSALPPAGARATARFAGAMPKLVTPNVSPALATASGTSGWYIAGIEMTTNAPSQFIHYGLVNLGRGDKQQNTLASIPSNIILDRVYIHGITSVSLQRCVGLNSAHTAIVNSTLSQCAAKGFDSQAIGGWNGPGPYRIQNNYLEGAGENIMFGGGDPFISNLVPSDITIRGNHITKQLSWKGQFTIKNLLETKNARRVLIENNIFENNWVDGQTGFAITLKSANQGGSAPWSITSDVTFRYNILRNSAAAFSISANPSTYPALPAARIKVEHNLIYDVGSFHGTTNGRMFQLMQGLNDLQIVSNTIVHNAVIGQFLIFADKGPAQRFIVRDNISSWGGPFGAVMGTAPQGTQALASFAGSSYAFDRNVVAGLPSNLLGGYPTTSYYAPTMGAVGFVNLAIKDYRLSASSPYALKSTTNGNPGADVSTVTSRTANVIVP